MLPLRSPRLDMLRPLRAPVSLSPCLPLSPSSLAQFLPSIAAVRDPLWVPEKYRKGSGLGPVWIHFGSALDLVWIRFLVCFLPYATRQEHRNSRPQSHLRPSPHREDPRRNIFLVQPRTDWAIQAIQATPILRAPSSHASRISRHVFASRRRVAHHATRSKRRPSRLQSPPCVTFVWRNSPASS